MAAIDSSDGQGFARAPDFCSQAPITSLVQELGFGKQIMDKSSYNFLVLLKAGRCWQCKSFLRLT